MTTRADVDRLTRANRAVVKQARADLRRFFASLAGTPEDRAAALIEFVPVLVREYGDLAAAVTAQWYEEVRSEYGLPPFDVALGGLADEAAVTGSARYAASRVFDGNSEEALSILMGAIQRHISYSTRDTVRRNVARDPGKPRFARVPSGAETCAFCEMLASRGFVYHTEAKAGEGARKGFGTDFHDECVVAGTIVSGPAAVAATSRRYEGEVITIGAGGHEVTVTPNHPILTGRGWVRAQFVNELDYLFVAESVERVVGSGPDVHEGPARVEDRFAALAMELESTRHRMPGTPEQFHGDGLDSEVDVVARHHLFGNEGDSGGGQGLTEFEFTGGSGPCPFHGGALASGCSPELGDPRPFGAPDRSVRSLNLLHAFAGGHLASSDFSGLAPSPGGDVSLREPSTNRSSSYAFDSGDGVLTFPGQIPAHEVARRLESVATRSRVDRVARSSYIGHVFNLSTRPHWYLANSIVTHNCDCQVVPEWDAEGNHIAGYDPDAMYERYLEARQIVEASLPPGAPIATSDILAALRRLYPDLYTDGVQPRID